MRDKLPTWAALLGATALAAALVLGAGAILPGPEGPGDERTARVKSYGGEVVVTATLDGDGAIRSLSVLTPNESEGLGKRCSEPAFTGQFIGRRGPFALGQDGVQAVAGATVTSRAVLDALNEITQR